MAAVLKSGRYAAFNTYTKTRRKWPLTKGRWGIIHCKFQSRPNILKTKFICRENLCLSQNFVGFHFRFFFLAENNFCMKESLLTRACVHGVCGARWILEGMGVG
jgi:hypothetical protein